MDYNFKSDATEQNVSNKKTQASKKTGITQFDQKPTPAFMGASWFALLSGTLAYCIILWNSEMLLNERGYYFTILLFGLFSAVSLQKSVRDKLEGLKVTEMYHNISWFSALSALVLLTIGLWNADLLASEKGFYAMSYLLSLFAAIAVQKNTRDKAYIEALESENKYQKETI